MSVAEDKIPPVPQLISPIKDVGGRNPDVDCSSFRFDNPWMQWFQNVKTKIDVINSDLASLSEITSAGLAARDASGTWSSIEIVPTDTSIIVTNGAGVAGNPSIKINPLWAGQATITIVGTITTGVWQGTDIANAYLDAAPQMTVTGTTATGGAASALPALPVGYVEVMIGGVAKKISYYD